MNDISKEEIEDVTKFTSAGGRGAMLASAAALLGANLVVIALAWDNPPSEGGIGTITFLMMISFVFFIHVMHQLMRFEYVLSRIGIGEKEKKHYREINYLAKNLRFMHVSGLLFTMIAFWIISYKYLVSLLGYNIIILTLPFILFLQHWIPKLRGLEREITFRSLESILQLVIQIAFLVLICLDFLRIITIP